MKITLAALILTLTSFSLKAATTATLLVKGVVPQILSIAVSAETIATSLPLSTSQTNTKIATIQEKSNSQTGYKVTISSANQGKLVRTGGSQQFSYSMSYNNSTLNLNSSVVLTNSGSSAVTVNKDLKISYTGVASHLMVAGDYVDTLTFTIAAN